MRGQRAEAEVGELQDLVIEGERADEHTDVTSCKFRRFLPAILQCLPGHLQQLALLRVHVVGFARADAEKHRVELVKAVNVAAAAAD